MDMKATLLFTCLIFVIMPSAHSMPATYKTKAQANPVWGRISWRAKCAKDAAQIVNDRQFEFRLGSDRQSVVDLAPHHVNGMPFKLDNKTLAAISSGQLNKAVVDISGALAKTYEFLKHIIKEEAEYNHDPQMQNALHTTKEQNENIREVLQAYMGAHGLKLDNTTQQEIRDITFDHYDEKSVRDNQSYVIIRDYIQLCSSIEDKFDIGD